MNAQSAAPMRVTLGGLGHQQPPTPVEADDTTASGVINGAAKQDMSKAIDMRFLLAQRQSRAKPI